MRLPAPPILILALVQRNGPMFAVMTEAVDAFARAWDHVALTYHHHLLLSLPEQHF